MQRPTSKGLINWLSTTTEDLADSVENLNNILADRESDPNWDKKAWATTRSMFSFRRLLPGLPNIKPATDTKAHKLKVRREIKVEEIEEVPSVVLD